MVAWRFTMQFLLQLQAQFFRKSLQISEFSLLNALQMVHFLVSFFSFGVSYDYIWIHLCFVVVIQLFKCVNYRRNYDLKLMSSHSSLFSGRLAMFHWWKLKKRLLLFIKWKIISRVVFGFLWVIWSGKRWKTPSF